MDIWYSPGSLKRIHLFNSRSRTNGFADKSGALLMTLQIVTPGQSPLMSTSGLSQPESGATAIRSVANGGAAFESITRYFFRAVLVNNKSNSIISPIWKTERPSRVLIVSLTSEGEDSGPSPRWTWPEYTPAGNALRRNRPMQKDLPECRFPASKRRSLTEPTMSTGSPPSQW